MATVLACSKSIVVPDTEPSIDGVIAELQPEVESVWIKEDLQEECGLVFGTNDDTSFVVRRPNGRLQPGDYDDLQVGMEIRVWLNPQINIVRDCPRGPALALTVEML